MPIKVRLYSPQSTPARKVKLVIHDDRQFTAQVAEVLNGLPEIGHVEDKKSLLLKHVVPNINRFVLFRGFWLMFRPAYRPARGGVAGSVEVTAILCMTPTTQRHEKDDMPCLRLSDPDVTLWPETVIEWTNHLTSSYIPENPRVIDHPGDC